MPLPSLEILNRIIFQSPFDRQVYLSTLMGEIGLTGFQATRLLTELVEAGVVEVASARCPQCFESIDYVRGDCPNCGHDLFSVSRFEVQGCLSKDNQIEYSKYASDRGEADRFAKRWVQQGHIFYLLIDLAESQIHQEQDSIAYNQFYADIRERVTRKALSKTKYALCLGEIGDCIKLAFMDANDAITALMEIARFIREDNLAANYPTLKGRDAPFPRFDGTLGKISIQGRYDDPKKVLCVTLNGNLDFNDYELTRLFRFDGAIKTQKRIYRDIMVTAWVQDDVLDEMEGWNKIPMVEIEAKAHERSRKSKFGLLTFNGTDIDPFRAVQHPGNYLS